MQWNNLLPVLNIFSWFLLTRIQKLIVLFLHPSLTILDSFYYLLYIPLLISIRFLLVCNKLRTYSKNLETSHSRTINYHTLCYQKCTINKRNKIILHKYFFRVGMIRIRPRFYFRTIQTHKRCNLNLRIPIFIQFFPIHIHTLIMASILILMVMLIILSMMLMFICLLLILLLFLNMIEWILANYSNTWAIRFYTSLLFVCLDILSWHFLFFLFYINHYYILSCLFINTNYRKSILSIYC